MKNQMMMDLYQFHKKYKFITPSGARNGYFQKDKPYIRSMKKINNKWHIDIKRYIYEMIKEYPQIKGKPGKRNLSIVGRKIKEYMFRCPSNPMFAFLKLSQKKIKDIKNIQKISTKKTPIKKVQRVAKKTLKKLPKTKFENDIQKRKELLWQLDSMFCYLMDSYWEESFESFARIFCSTTEEFFKYVLKKVNRKSA